MTQETRETTDAIIEDDQKDIEAIIDANKDRIEPYWIVIFAKPSKNCVDGKPTMVKHIKAYAFEPPAQVGMISCKVDPQAQTFTWDINMPQIPFDFDALLPMGAQEKREDVVETSSLKDSYVTKNMVA